MNRISGTAVLIIVLFGGVWLFVSQEQSSATLSDTEIVRSRVQAESVDISISQQNGAIATFTLENMAPGDEFRGEIIIENGGSLPVLYGVTSMADPSPLNQFLVMNIWTGAGGCNQEQLPNVQLFSGLFSETTTDVVGVTETQDRFRPLAEGKSEAICAQIVLPADVGNEAQNQTSRQRFTVFAIHDIEKS
jgi:HAMP domain-containing protein